MTPNDVEKLTRLIVRALQDDGPEADAAITIARDIARRSPDFRPDQSVVVMSPGDTSKWQRLQSLILLGDNRLRQARQYSEALLGELEGILAQPLIAKIKRKAAKV